MVLLNNLFAIVFCFAAVLTCSRAAILAAGGIYLLCCVVTLVFSRNLFSRVSTAFCILCMLAVGICVLKGSETLLQTIFANACNRIRASSFTASASAFSKSIPYSAVRSTC